MAKYLKHTAREQLLAMSNQWADTDTICTIGNIGRNKAIEIRVEIEEQVKQDGYRLPRQKIVPMKYVIDYFNIDINYLKKLAKLEELG